MHIVRNMVAVASDRPPREQVVLEVERRQFLKRRWRGVAADGTEFGFDLESRLRDGCVVMRSPSADYIVRQRPEEVWEVLLESPGQAALVGWRIGNLHFPVEVTAHGLRVTRDPAVQQLLEREGWHFEEVTAVFNPLRAVAHAS
jgi:urease accessory protein